LSITVFVKI